MTTIVNRGGWLLLLALAWILGANRLEAGGNVTGAISSVGYSTPGSEQDLFFAPGYPDRSQVRVSVLANFSASASVVGAQYRFVARLLDVDGNPVNLRGPDGLPTTAYAFPQFSVSLPAGSVATRSDTLSLSIADGVRLNPYSAYRVELTLQYLAGATWTPEGPVRTSSNRRFFHFLNQTSGDVPYNVIAEILSVEWKRTHAIDAASGDHHWLEAEVAYRLHRYDNFAFGSGPAVPSDNIPVRFAVSVRTGHGATVATTVDAGDTLTAAASFREGIPRTPWTSDIQIRRIRFHPNVQLPSGTEPDFRAAVTISHVEDPFVGAYVPDHTVESGNATVLHFTGRLDWGGITTSLRDFSNDPSVGLVRRASDVSVSLQNSVAVTPGIATSFTVDPTIQVALDDFGTARVLSGNGQVALATTERTLHGLRYQIPGPIHLGPGGADADVMLRLPAGMGVGKPGFALNSRLTSHLNAFTSLLEPTGINSFPVTADERVVLDTRPLYFPTPQLRWNSGTGELQFTPSGVDYVRREAFEVLAAAVDLPADQTSKPSNERYYQFVTGVAGAFTVRVGTDGRPALSGGFALSAGQFVSHFPRGVTTAWSVGQLFLQDDLPIGMLSVLLPSGPVTVAYEQGCPDGACAGQTAELACDVPQFFFTPDGGLVAEGNAAASVGSENWLRWGHNPSPRDVMAHEAGPFHKAAFAMSGHVLLGGTLPAADIANGAGVLMESGATISAAAVPSGVRMIRPGTADYLDGVGQYPGLNLTRAAETDPAAVYGIARLGDAESSVNFPLTARAKYYARLAGVSGLHEASPGGFALPLTIYRYPFEFQAYGLSFLANSNVNSETRCEIQLPAPVAERFTFDSLTFTCVGAPDQAAIAEGQSEKTFRYWLAKIDAQSAGFAPRNRAASACDASAQRFLALGSVVHGSGIRDSLAATLYLSPDGEIITPADTERPEGVSFYFGAGSTVSVAGVIDSTTHLPTSYYQLALGKAYFNDPDPFERTETGRGWLNLFGGLKLPFYGQTPVHLMALPTKNGDPHTPSYPSDLSSVYYINGGWTDGPVRASDPTGDLGHRGVPPGMTWAAYRSNTAFAPNARGDFLDVINLDFPLIWSPGLREFSGGDPIEHSLLFILETSRELFRLSPTDIEIQLGAAYQGLPRLHFTSAKIDLVFASVDTPLTDFGAVVLDVTGRGLADDVRRGFGAMRTLAGEQLAGEAQRIVTQLVASVAPGLRDAVRRSPAEREAAINAAFAPLRLDEHTLLLAEGLATPGLRSTLIDQLGTASASLRSLWTDDIGLFSPVSGEGRIHLALVIREMLVRGFAGTIDHLSGPSTEELLRPFEADLNHSKALMLHVADRLDELRARFTSDSGDVNLELRALFSDPASVAELGSLINEVRLNLIEMANRPHWVEENVAGPGDSLELQLAARIGRSLSLSEFHARLDRTFKYHLRSLEEDGISAADGMLAMMQRMVNRIGRIALRAADEYVGSTLRGGWAGKFGFGNAEGYVLFSGDEVRRLRLSGKGGVDFAKVASSSGSGLASTFHTDVQFQVGARFEINALDSEGERFCGTGDPAKAGECTLEFSTDTSWDEASTVIATSREDERAWGTARLSDPLPREDSSRAASEFFQLNLKATFDETGLTAFGGGFVWETKKDFGAIRVARVSGACSFGLTEKYVAGSLEGTFGGGDAQLQGGIFLGSTCTLEPLKLINPDVTRLLGDERPFSGIYAYVRGWKSFFSGGCLYNLSGGVGVGVIVDIESERFGGSLFAGVKGELLCALSLTGEVELTALADDGYFVFDGTARLRARLGYCPFCVTLAKEVGTTYRQRTDTWESHSR